MVFTGLYKILREGHSNPICFKTGVSKFFPKSAQFGEVINGGGRKFSLTLIEPLIWNYWRIVWNIMYNFTQAIYHELSSPSYVQVPNILIYYKNDFELNTKDSSFHSNNLHNLYCHIFVCVYIILWLTIPMGCILLHILWQMLRAGGNINMGNNWPPGRTLDFGWTSTLR